MKKNKNRIEYVEFNDNLFLKCSFNNSKEEEYQYNGKLYKRHIVNLKNCVSFPFIDKGDKLNYRMSEVNLIYEPENEKKLQFDKTKYESKLPIGKNLQNLGFKKEANIKKGLSFLVDFDKPIDLYCDLDSIKGFNDKVIIEVFSAEKGSNETTFFKAKKVNLGLKNCENVPLKTDEDNFIITNAVFDFIPEKSIVDIQDKNVSIEDKIKIIEARIGTLEKMRDSEESSYKRIDITDEINENNSLLQVLKKSIEIKNKEKII